MNTDFRDDFDADEQPPDPREEDAREALEAFFEANREAVFFSRQIEVQHEDKWYHWITNRALRDLVESRVVKNVGGAVGLHGEHMVLEGFARRQFVMRGRHANAYGSRTWESTAHDFDFIFERDSIAYGVEVKNTLGYMDYEELKVKLRMCGFLGIKPVFATRMLPKISSELGLPVDTPKALAEGTMDRFVRWHEKNL